MTATTRDAATEKVPTGGLVVEDLGVMLTGKDSGKLSVNINSTQHGHDGYA